MRTFNFLFLASLALVSLTGCPSNEHNCASTVGCGDDDDVPGPDAGGDDLLGGNPSEAPYCAEADKPMRCEDETASCRTTGYDCVHPAYACGGEMFTCYEYGDGYHANCCDEELVVCPPGQAKFYCPETGTCVDPPGDDSTIGSICPSVSRCTIQAAGCNTAENI
jgi:hypothetical protein